MDDITQTPETLPSSELPATMPNSSPTNTSMTKPPKHSWIKVLHWRHTHLSKPKWLLLWLSILIAVGASSFGLYKLYRHYRSPSHIEKSKPHAAKPAAPTTEASRLSGLQVAPELNKRPVTGIMIENSPDARPQSALNSAGIVYEAIAEGGITRFLALFEDTQPDYIGPVRSVRPYYLDFLMPFDAPVAHVGGAPQALADIRSLGIKDLDEFANAGAYQRIPTRYAPHNVYTSTADLDALNQKKGFTSSTFTSFPRKKDEPSAQPTARSIDFAISSYLYNAHYDYDPASNSYKRSEGGKPHTDEKSGAQLEPKVVIALVMGRGIDGDGQHTDYTTTGSGHMYLFQDGTVAEGNWSKADRKSQFVFTNLTNQPLKLNAGQTWISIVDPGAVTFAP